MQMVQRCVVSRQHVLVKTAVVATLLLLTAAAALTVRAAEESPRADCCYTNPRYSGACAVELGEAETCASVLEYLNNAASVGKTYCAGTNIRVGWQQVECAEEED